MSNKSVINVDRSKCTGCGACENICPVGAITMEYDNDGFLYPTVGENCIDCGKCMSSCQAVTPLQFHPVPKSYAVMADDEIRKVSSSGGFFSIIATYVLSQGGVVFGAVYSDDFKGVYITEAESIEQLNPMRGSKYVFCETKDSYKRAKKALDAGRLVLYTGTPCEIAGIRLFLGKEYENLWLVDFICHAANSVKAYKSWLNEFTDGRAIKRLDFRDKNFFGWSTPAVAYLEDGTVVKQNYNDCFWYKGFLEGVINRDNCSTCQFARAERVSDFTMGDAWQVGRINANLNDGIGTSLILVNSEKAKKLYDLLKDSMKLSEEIPLEEIRKYNGNLNWPQKQSPARKFFFSHLDKHGYHKSLWYGRGMRWDFGLVGWWFASNYGSALTYYALAKTLENMGKAPIFIPIPKLDNSQWDSGTKVVEDFIGRYFRIARKRDVEHMKEYNHFCDGFILGSDQMWTESTTKLVGYSFFLDFVDLDKKKIACAPSFGAGRYTGDITIRNISRDYLKRFDAVSVREESGVQICKDIFGIEAKQIIDPIFWADIEEFDKLADSVKNYDVPDKYMLCYILDPDDKKLELAKQIAKERNLEVVTIPGMREVDAVRTNWNLGRILEKVSIEEFVYLIKNCQFLFTDSHHGVCMGIKYNKNYIAVGNKLRGIDRFFTVANLLGLQDRVITLEAGKKVDVSEFIDIDYEYTNKLMEENVASGIKWLSDAIQKNTACSEETVYTLLRRIEMLEQKLHEIENK